MDSGTLTTIGLPFCSIVANLISTHTNVGRTEFLNLKEETSYTESQLEQALIDKLQYFLLELGKGFAFVARQKRITITNRHYYIDLVFYNRLLKCLVLIDLKTGEPDHSDIGQTDL